MIIAAEKKKVSNCIFEGIERREIDNLIEKIYRRRRKPDGEQLQVHLIRLHDRLHREKISDGLKKETAVHFRRFLSPPVCEQTEETVGGSARVD